MRLRPPRKARRFPTSNFIIFLCLTALITAGAFAAAGLASGPRVEGSRSLEKNGGGEAAFVNESALVAPLPPAGIVVNSKGDNRRLVNPVSLTFIAGASRK